MRASRLHSPLDFRLHDEPVPQPSSGEVLIRVGSVSVCASDIHWYQDGRIGPTILKEPTILGHEASGIIAGLGNDVKGLEIGQRVAIEPARPCFECEWCRKGFFNVCPEVKFFGTAPTDGAFRDFLTWPARLVEKIPDSMSLDEAAIAEPLGVGMHAVNIADIEGASRVAILGAGAIGLSVLQYLRLVSSAQTVISDPVNERREIAASLGADAVCRPDEMKGPFDLVFECTGEADAVLQCAKICRIMGQVIIVGIPTDDRYTFDASAARRRQLRVVFSRRSNETLGRVIELISEKKLDASALATHTFPLEELETAFRLAAKKEDGVIRAIIKVSR